MSRPYCLYFGNLKSKQNRSFGNQDALNRTYSLKKNKSFRYVYRRGKNLVYENLAICYVIKKTPGLQVGFSVSKKVGNAVIRNRVKRRLKEAFSVYLEKLKPNALIIIIARPGIADKAYPDVQRNIERILAKAGLFRTER